MVSPMRANDCWHAKDLNAVAMKERGHKLPIVSMVLRTIDFGPANGCSVVDAYGRSS